MSTTHATVDHLFRHEYARIVALLTARFSVDKIDLIEDAVQESLIKAMRTWPFSGEPDEPAAWLYRVAYRELLDRLRRAAKSTAIDAAALEDVPEEPSFELSEPGTIQDEMLQMIFACCHPSLSTSDQLLLALKLLSGLSTKEIANALLKKPDAVKRSITRAKERFRVHVGQLSIPQGEGLIPRLSAVFQVIYLMFNEGYKSSGGEQLVKKDICEEAIRLGILLSRNPSSNTYELRALLALMCLQYARIDARIDENGGLQPLEFQDRNRWDQEYITAGIDYLNASVNGVSWTRYHLMAGIAAFYSTAENYEATDWKGILGLYNLLVRSKASPIARLNRVVVLEKVEGTESALAELNELSAIAELQKSHLFFAIKADVVARGGDMTSGQDLLQKAIDLADNEVERQFMQRKLQGWVEQELAAS